MAVSRSEKAVAIFEATKGLLVLVAGLGLLEGIHKDVQAAAEDLVAHLHLNPASRVPRIFLHLAARATDRRIIGLAIGAALYAAFRFAEAYGLWKGKRWAEWLALISAAIYIPFELRGMYHRPNGLAAVALVVNLIVVMVMAQALRQGQGAEAAP